MKHFIKITLLLILITYSELAVARNSNSAHTHTNTPIELEFVSSNSAHDFKLAAVCFLGQSNCAEAGFSKGDDDMDINPADQCKNDGFDKTCPAGWHPDLKPGKDCPYDPSYKTCCKETCPTNAATNCTGTAVGDDGCGYTCKKCCSDDCPKWTAKNYSGAISSKTECGNNCYKCKCPGSSSPSFTGTSAGSSECGTCYNCNTTCPRGQKSLSCSSKYRKVSVASDECGSSCYECQYNTDCDAKRTSCSKPYECSYNSCGICSSCRYNYDCDDRSTSCSGKGYSCDYNSCNICTSCSYNYDCDATPKNCEYGCSSSNSCGICNSCNSKPITYTAIYSGSSYCESGGSWTGGSVGEFCSVSVSCSNGYSDGGRHIVDSHASMSECTPHDCSSHNVYGSTGFHPSRCGM